MGNTLSLILHGYIYPFDYWVETLNLSLIKFQRKGTVFFQLPIEGNGTPLQYSCLENSMDGGAW